jgi:hypothetical protein
MISRGLFLNTGLFGHQIAEIGVWQDLPPYLPFAISVGIGSIGWKGDIPTKFLHELT